MTTARFHVRQLRPDLNEDLYCVEITRPRTEAEQIQADDNFVTYMRSAELRDAARVIAQALRAEILR